MIMSRGQNIDATGGGNDNNDCVGRDINSGSDGNYEGDNNNSSDDGGHNDNVVMAAMTNMIVRSHFSE